MPVQNIVITISPGAGPLVERASREFASYIRRLAPQEVRVDTDDEVRIVPSDEYHFALGTTESHRQIAERGSEFSPGAIGNEGYHIRSYKEERVTVIAGGDPSGAVYGMYALLDAFGCSFHLYGDILPERLKGFPDLEIDVLRRPRFTVRGMQLWNYWYPGRDSWNIADYERYLDQYPKLGFNLFDFPLYFYEPLYTNFTVDGTAPEGYQLGGFDLDLIRVGREHFGARRRFTSPDIPHHLPQQERNHTAITQMRQVFAYAHARGIRTGVGIELSNSLNLGRELLDIFPAEDRYEQGQLIAPSSQSAAKLARARLIALLDAYPDCDYVTLWQPESGIFRTTDGSPHPEDVAFRQRYQRYADRLAGADYDYLEWVLLGYHILKELKPNIRIVSGGWGTERIFPAADEIWPHDIIRSTLAYYESENTLAHNRLPNYEATTAPKWHIPWAETDQHMWTVQHKTEATYKVLQELDRYGVSGTLLLHWRNLFPDLDIKCYAYGSWDRASSLEDHWRHWVRAKFGLESDLADPMIRALSAVEAYNHHTVAGLTQIQDSLWWVGYECFINPMLMAHRWLAPLVNLHATHLDKNVQHILKNAPGAITLLSQALGHLNEAGSLVVEDAGKERFAYFYNRVAFTRALFEAHLTIAATLSKAILALDALNSGDPTTFRTEMQAALQSLQSVSAEDVVRLFATWLGESSLQKDAGELGLLVSLNEKFLGGVKRIEGRLLRLLDMRPDDFWGASPQAMLAIRCGRHIDIEAPATYNTMRGSLRSWSEELDETSSEPGFSYEVELPLYVKPITPDLACWTNRDRIRLRLTTPAGFVGRLRLYLYEDPEWDTLFRWQSVTVNGETLGNFSDFFCRGDYWDEGIWVETPINPEGSFDVRSIVIEIQRTGNADVMLSAVELVAEL